MAPFAKQRHPEPDKHPPCLRNTTEGRHSVVVFIYIPLSSVYAIDLHSHLLSYPRFSRFDCRYQKFRADRRRGSLSISGPTRLEACKSLMKAATRIPSQSEWRPIGAEQFESGHQRAIFSRCSIRATSHQDRWEQSQRHCAAEAPLANAQSLRTGCDRPRAND